MKRVAFAAALLATPVHASTLQDYGWAWPLSAQLESGAYQVELTPDIYRASTDFGLRDIEVFNTAGEAVPVAIVAFDQRLVMHDEQVTLPVFTLPRNAGSNAEDLHLHLERDADGRLHRLDAETTTLATQAPLDYVLDASSAHGDLDNLRLEWRDEVGEVNAQFAIDASDDLQQWQPLITMASVIDLQQGGARLTRRHIPLPGAHSNYLRLRRLDAGAALAGLAVQARLRTRESATVPARRWIQAVPLSTAAPPAAESADVRSPAVTYYYRLPGALATEGARIELASDNSLARLSLAHRNSAAVGSTTSAAPGWIPRGDLTAFRLRQEGVRIDSDELMLDAGGRADEWRIQAWQPLDQPPTLTLAWRPERLVFLARGAGPYRLAAGSRSARRADYPIDAALTQLRARLGATWQPPLAALGERATVVGAAAVQAAPSPRPWKTWLLWSVLVAGAVVVMGMAVQLLREAKSGE